MIASAFSLWHGDLRFVVRDGEVERKSMAAIAEDVAAQHNLTVADLTGDRRVHGVVVARQEAMADMYATGRYSLPVIGAFLGGRDHTTVLHGVRAHKRRLVGAIGADDPNCRTVRPLAAE